MKASRFMYMIGGALIATGLINLTIEPGFILQVGVGVIATFIATGLDLQDI